MGAFDYQHAMANPDESLTPIYQEIYQESELSMGQVGMIRRLGPRTYVYSKAGGTGLAIGLLTIQPTPAANHQNVAVQAAAEIGAEEVTVTLGATLASSNQYEDGFMVVTDATGEGTCYRIKSNPAADSAATLTLTLYDKLHTALTTSSEVCLIPNPYNGLVIAVTDQLDLPAGVPNIGVTASYYFWAQTGGPCAVLSDETVAQGLDVTIGTSVAGAVEGVDAAGEPLVGRAIIALVDTEYRPVDLMILR